MDVTRHREVSTLKTYDRLSNMQEKPFCDFRRRVVSADRVLVRARGRPHLWSDMAKLSQGNIADAPFEIDSANWRLIEEAYQRHCRQTFGLKLSELPKCFSFPKTSRGRANQQRM